MALPWAAVASTGELPAGAFDGAAVAASAPAAGAGEDDPAAVGVAAEAAVGGPGVAAGAAAAGAGEDDPAAGGAAAAADVPPRLVT